MKIRFYLIMFLFIIFSEVYAEPSLLINSDKFTFDNNINKVTFKQNVTLWFEDLVLKTSEVQVLYKTKKGEKAIYKIVIPSYVTATRFKEDQTLVSDSAVYFPNTQKLVLKGNVYLQHYDNVLKTKELVYYSDLKRIDN